MKKNEDKKAILARREAFINQVMSKEETNAAKAGSLPTICLSIGEPCLIPQICLTIET